MPVVAKITPCLWFDDQGEDAAAFYTGVFPNSRITSVSRYGEAGQEVHGKTPGTAMVVAFELDGQPFTALNGGPQFKFTEAVSFQVGCDTQAEVDYYWEKLSVGGDPAAQQCGWLKDRFGVSWQVVPNAVQAMMSGPDAAKSQRMMGALMGMKKLVIADLQRAYAPRPRRSSFSTNPYHSLPNVTTDSGLPSFCISRATPSSNSRIVTVGTVVVPATARNAASRTTFFKFPPDSSNRSATGFRTARIASGVSATRPATSAMASLIPANRPSRMLSRPAASGRGKSINTCIRRKNAGSMLSR